VKQLAAKTGGKVHQFAKQQTGKGMW